MLECFCVRKSNISPFVRWCWNIGMAIGILMTTNILEMELRSGWFGDTFSSGLWDIFMCFCCHLLCVRLSFFYSSGVGMALRNTSNAWCAEVTGIKTKEIESQSPWIFALVYSTRSTWEWKRNKASKTVCGKFFLSSNV